MPVKMTETAIHSAAKRAADTGKRLDLSDATLPGLRLRLTPAGGRAWVLACRDTLGQMRRFPLGDHPAMGVSDAREAARAMRTNVRQGADPVAEARRKRAIGREAREGIGTLTALLDLYASKQGGSLKSWPECRRRIDSVFKNHLAKPLATMKPGDLQMTADAHKAQQSAAAAVRYLRPVLRWASAPGRGYVSADLTRIVPPATVRRRDRVLSRDELARLLPVLRQSDRPYAAAMLFMLLTLARREEVGAARWRTVDLDAGTWSITETKNGKPHVVPLSRQAADLLRLRRPDQPAADALVFATTNGHTLGNWDRETKALQEASETTAWTRHDLRRTGATMLGEMGELPDIIEAALNHTSIRSSLAATYNQARYRPQVAVALQRLADALDAIEVGHGRLVITRVSDLAGVAPPEREWVVPDWLPVGAVTLNYGDGGTGKSLLAQQLMTSCAIGGRWLGLDVLRCKSFALFCEDDNDELHRRQLAICASQHCGIGDLAAMEWTSRVGEDNLLVTFDTAGRAQRTKLLAALVKAIREHEARLIIIDTASDTFGGNENDRSQVRQYIGRILGGIAHELKAAILVNAQARACRRLSPCDPRPAAQTDGAAQSRLP